MFLFKEKTSYEVRMSDGSSDVCSSDRRRARMGRVSAQGGGGRDRAVEFPGQSGDEPACRRARGGQPRNGQDQRIYPARRRLVRGTGGAVFRARGTAVRVGRAGGRDRKSTRLDSSQ